MSKPELSKLGYVALVTPDLEKSLWFFKEVIGLEETKISNGVHYLRAFGDFGHHTLSLEKGDSGYVKHVGWRTKRSEDVAAFKEALLHEGVEVESIPAGTTNGVGEAIRFKLASGHSFELY